jgi:hypothetical protein
MCVKVSVAITTGATYVADWSRSIAPPAANTSDTARGYMHECDYYPLVVPIEPSVVGAGRYRYGATVSAVDGGYACEAGRCIQTNCSWQTLSIGIKVNNTTPIVACKVIPGCGGVAKISAI